MHQKRRPRVDTQQEWACIHKYNTQSVKILPKHKKPQPLQLCRSPVVPYKFVQVAL